MSNMRTIKKSSKEVGVPIRRRLDLILNRILLENNRNKNEKVRRVSDNNTRAK